MLKAGKEKREEKRKREEGRPFLAHSEVEKLLSIAMLVEPQGGKRTQR